MDTRGLVTVSLIAALSLGLGGCSAEDDFCLAFKRADRMSMPSPDQMQSALERLESNIPDSAPAEVRESVERLLDDLPEQFGAGQDAVHLYFDDTCLS